MKNKNLIFTGCQLTTCFLVVHLCHLLFVLLLPKFIVVVFVIFSVAPTRFPSFCVFILSAFEQEEDGIAAPWIAKKNHKRTGMDGGKPPQHRGVLGCPWYLGSMDYNPFISRLDTSPK